MISRVAGLVDRVVYEAALARSKSSRAGSRAEGLGHADRLEALEAIARLYPADDARFFAPLGDAVPDRRIVRRFGRGGEVLDLTWPSRLAPFVAETAEKLAKVPENATAHARFFTVTGASRPAVVVIHGYLSGNYTVDGALFPVEHFLRRGLDVALFVLPFHGPRRGSRSRPLFPASDPRVTIEGFRQAAYDFGRLAAILRSMGAPSVGVTGMSLGGYTAGLLATVFSDIAFAIPLVPLASIADFAEDGGRLVGTRDEQALQREALDRAHAVVSPVMRSLRIPTEKVVVLGGRRDRITPVSHAVRMATHFGCGLELFDGGHLVQAGRLACYDRALDRVLS